MPNTYTNLLFHIVYSTKYRKPLIKAEWQDDLYGYMGGIIRDAKGRPAERRWDGGPRASARETASDHRRLGHAAT